jgi:hypothetical protein
MSMWRMPYSESGSTTAFITAGSEPAHPASPHPLAAPLSRWHPDHAERFAAFL